MPASGSLYTTDAYGQVTASATVAPLHIAKGRFGLGTAFEEATVNLCQNPTVEVGATGWSVNSGNTTNGRDTTRAYLGTASFKVTWNVTETSGVNGAALTNPNAGSNFVQVTVGTTYTGSMYVWTPVPKTFQPIMRFRAGDYSNSFTSDNNGVSQVVPGGVWTRISQTIVAPAGAGSLFFQVSMTANAGDVAWFDCMQIEPRAYPTSYTDGIQGTGYGWASTSENPATPNPDFAVNTTNWSSVCSTTQYTLARVTGQSGNGMPLTTALEVSIAANANTFMLILGTLTSPQTGFTSGSTYTGSFWAKSISGNTNLTAQFSSSSGAHQITAAATSYTLTTTWTRYFFTFTVAGGATGLAQSDVGWYLAQPGGGGLATDYMITALQIEQRDYPTSYHNAGTAHQAASQRAKGSMTFTGLTNLNGPVSLVAWLTPTSPTGGTTRAFIRGLSLGSPTGSNHLSMTTWSLGQLSLETTGSANQRTLSQATGDAIFAAITNDGAGNAIGYTAVNGAAVGATTFTGVSAPTAAYDRVLFAGTNFIYEQVLVYNYALSAAEVTYLSTLTTPWDLPNDGNIVFAYNTPSTLAIPGGAVALMSNAGANQVRRALNGYGVATMSPISEVTMTNAPVPVGTTHVVTLVSTTSGIGQGDTIEVEHPNLAGQRLVFTVLGQYTGSSTELYCLIS